MLDISKTKEDLKEDLSTFTWDFKIADNIKYNLDVLFNLVKDSNSSPLGIFEIPTKNYKKPISLIAFSIIEAIMVDFLYRLYQGSNHFPQKLKEQEKIIKSKLSKKTNKIKYIDSQNHIHWIYPLKNIDFTTMIKFYQEFNILGENQQNYETLTKMAQFRNRIHILNYFNNFEKDEYKTFSEERVQKMLNGMAWIFNYFKKNYPRPWSK